MATDHERAAILAVRTSAELKRLFGRLGTKEHPRGRIPSAYRAARRSLKGNTGDRLTVAFTLLDLRRSIEAAVVQILSDAAAAGRFQAQREADIYGLPVVNTPINVDDGTAAILAQYDSQAAAVRGLLAIGQGESVILGDSGRVGVLTPAPVIRESARWTTGAAIGGYNSTITLSLQRANVQDEFVKQAIAAIDERTTDCCLRVHGQTVPIDGDFTLTGTPRYADKMKGPGFHWYCRTAIAMVRKADANGDFTQRMQDAARAELKARKDIGGRVEIAPADAFSRR